MHTHTRVRGRVIVRSLLVAWFAAFGLALVVAAAPATGTPSGGATSSASASQPAQVRAHASAHHILNGGPEIVTGSTGQPGGAVVAKVNRGSGWKTAAHARTGGGGRFKLAWRQHGLGHYAVRIALTGSTARRDIGGGLTVYKRSKASWYGPGFYGHRTACGGTLSSHTLGVANKSLPCGTKVTLRYHSRMVTVPVIDRGPYVAGREYDLTAATKNRLHFGSTGTLWSAPRTR